MRTTALVLTFVLGPFGLAGSAVAQTSDPVGPPVTTGGAGNTGVEMPGSASGLRTSGPGAGTAATPSNTPVPGTTPGVNIGGTPTAGPPGTGGTAGGPALGNR